MTYTIAHYIADWLNDASHNAYKPSSIEAIVEPSTDGYDVIVKPSSVNDNGSRLYHIDAIGSIANALDVHSYAYIQGEDIYVRLW